MDPKLSEAGTQDPINRLLEIVATLRGEGGCPWDRKQTLESLKPYLIEEAYELVDAVDSGDVEHHAEELGDVLLQVLLHAQIRDEEGAFDFNDVARQLGDKLIRRHPHVFGDTTADDADAVLKNWEAIKASENKDKDDAPRSAVGGIPRHLPSLQKAQRIQSRVARVGFDWTEMQDVIAKIDEELAETREAIAAGDAAAVKEEIGDLLFSVVNLSRFNSLAAEEALEQTIVKFVRRFQGVERRLHARDLEMSGMTLEELDAEWNAVKREERGETDNAPDITGV